MLAGWLAIAKTNELTDGFYKINTELSFLHFFLISEFSLSSVHVHVPIRNVLGFQFLMSVFVRPVFLFSLFWNPYQTLKKRQI